LLLAILGWQVYRTIAKAEGIPLLVNDNTAAEALQLLRSMRQHSSATPAAANSTANGAAAGGP
jgi:hypothetical protein